MNPEIVAGDPLWQKVIGIAALLFILWNIRDGYRKGFLKKMAGLGAIIAAYICAFLFNEAAAQWLQPYIPYPFLFVRALAGVLIAVVVYFAVKTVAYIVLPDEADEERTSSHLGGLLAGSLVGLIWVYVTWVAISFLGNFAECAAQAKAGGDTQQLYEENAFLANLVKVKNSAELGMPEGLADKLDPVPREFYVITDKVIRLLNDPQACQALAQDPNIQDLMNAPNILALTKDAEIKMLVQERNFHTLLRHKKLRAVADDKALQDKIFSMDFESALDKALAYGNPPEPTAAPEAANDQDAAPDTRETPPQENPPRQMPPTASASAQA